MTRAYYLQLPIEFPEGVHFGGGDNYNTLLIARDGRGWPTLNGTSLAGMLRSIWTDFQVVRQHSTANKSVYEIAKLRRKVDIQEQVSKMFGAALGSSPVNERDTNDRQSCVKVTNYRLHTGTQESREQFELRTFHLSNRHRGKVVDNGLFSIEACPPGTNVTAGIWILGLNSISDDEIEQFIDVIVGAFQFGVHVGGNSNRGLGRAIVNDAEVRIQRFDLSKLDDHVAYLDSEREWRQTGKVQNASEYQGNFSNKLSSESLVVELTLQIPKGQDLLIAAGKASEVTADPQYVANAHGQFHWRLPGSSLRGLFNKWFHHLDARERIANSELSGIDHGDAAVDYLSREYTAHNRAWCFQSESERQTFEVPQTWRVTSLFGSCYHPGRIKISDGYSACSGQNWESSKELQKRVHVAVDRITGGAAEGFLFDNRVLTSANNSVSFPIRIVIHDPREHEARWLAQTLVALHLGVLRAGSNKSAGRLEIKTVNTVSGRCKDAFSKILSSIGK